VFLRVASLIVAFQVSVSVGTVMNVDEMVCEILSACPGVTRRQIIERLEGAKKKTGDLISDDALLRMVAAELGCSLSGNGASLPLLLFADLLPGLRNVTVVGRVVAVFPSKSFGGVRKGKLASVLLADRSGILRVVLWNEKADVAESGVVKVGQVVRFAHGYTREDMGGIVELHVGENCKVDVSPKDVDARDYPLICTFNVRIRELPDLWKRRVRVNIAGTVKNPSAVSTFERKDSTTGKVLRFVLTDATGEIPVVAWNEKVEEVEHMLKDCTALQIVSARLKEGTDKCLEVHVDAGTYLEPFSSDRAFSELASLKEGMTKVNVRGEVTSKPVLRNVKTSVGEAVELALFELKDGTGTVWVSAWRQHATTAKSLTVGKRVALKNVYAKKGFGEHLEISTRNSTSIEVE
jgi:replication factor A1